MVYESLLPAGDLVSIVKKKLFPGHKLSRCKQANPNVTANTQQLRNEVRPRPTMVQLPHATADASGVEYDVSRQGVQVADTHRVVHLPYCMRLIAGHQLADVLPHKVAGPRRFRSKHSKAMRIRPAQHKPSAQAKLNLHVSAAPRTTSAIGSSRWGQVRATHPTSVQVALSVDREARAVIRSAARGRHARAPDTTGAEAGPTRRCRPRLRCREGRERSGPGAASSCPPRVVDKMSSTDRRNQRTRRWTGAGGRIRYCRSHPPHPGAPVK